MRRIVRAGIVISKAARIFLAFMHLRNQLRRVERPLIVSIQSATNLPPHFFSDFGLLRVKVSIYWHMLLHVLGHDEAMALLVRGHKPQMILASEHRPVRPTTAGEQSPNDESLSIEEEGLSRRFLPAIAASAESKGKKAKAGNRGSSAARRRKRDDSDSDSDDEDGRGGLSGLLRSLGLSSSLPLPSTLRGLQNSVTHRLGMPMPDVSARPALPTDETCRADFLSQVVMAPAVHGNAILRFDLVNEHDKRVATATVLLRDLGGLMNWREELSLPLKIIDYGSSSSMSARRSRSGSVVGYLAGDLGSSLAGLAGMGAGRDKEKSVHGRAGGGGAGKGSAQNLFASTDGGEGGSKGGGAKDGNGKEGSRFARLAKQEKEKDIKGGPKLKVLLSPHEPSRCDRFKVGWAKVQGRGWGTLARAVASIASARSNAIGESFFMPQWARLLLSMDGEFVHMYENKACVESVGSFACADVVSISVENGGVLEESFGKANYDVINISVTVRRATGGVDTLIFRCAPLLMCRCRRPVPCCSMHLSLLLSPPPTGFPTRRNATRGLSSSSR
jgi:hypothetical protein